MRRITELWRAHPVMLVAFVLAAAITLFFLIRTVAFTVYWADPAHRDQRIEPWMTFRYVANSWDLPPEVMIEALDYEPRNGRSMTLGELAAARGETVEELTERIKAAALAYRADNP